MAKATKIFLIAGIALASFSAGVLYRESAGQQAGSGAAPGVLYYACPMHPQYRSDRPGDCPSCGMRLEPARAEARRGEEATAAGLPAGAMQIDPAAQRLAGVRLKTVERASTSQLLRTTGRVAPDENRLYRINASTEMWIRHLSPPTTGSLVRKDDLLCGFYTTNYLAAAQSYLYILDAVDRMRAAGQDSSAQAASNDVQLRQATELLQNLGVSDFQVREIAKTRQAGSLVQVRSPTDGYVLSRNVSLGQWIGPGTELYQIADLGHVWIFADLFDKEAGTVAPGMAVRVMQRNKGLALTATVSNVPPTFDETSRTTRVRLEAENPGLSLWPGMFVEVEFPLRMPPAIAVPVDAVIDSGLRKTVYVVRDGNYFEPRIVETGWRLGNQVEIVKGLAPGEQIVVSGNFLLDSESRMRMTGSEAGAAAEPHIHAMTSELDPVCGMRVKPAEAAGKSEYKGKTYYFCSSFCKREFDKDPETALKKGMNR